MKLRDLQAILTGLAELDHCPSATLLCESISISSANVVSTLIAQAQQPLPHLLSLPLFLAETKLSLSYGIDLG